MLSVIFIAVIFGFGSVPATASLAVQDAYLIPTQQTNAHQTQVVLDDAKEQVRQASDITQVLGAYLDLRRQGRNFVARCPWHDDSRPSMTINPERQSWRCWVCNIGGDVFSFVMKKENIEFREALEMLADKANITLQSQGPRPEAGSPQDKNTLFAAMTWAQKLYADCLLKADSGAPGREYVQERHLSPESVSQFGLGFVPNEWTYLTDRAKQSPYSPEILDACGLTLRSENSGRTYDRYRGRLMFPIYDVQGRVIAFGGRILPQWASENPAKYINSPETRLFSKSDQLYALNLAKDTISKSRHITVVEGYTDVIMAHQHGLTDVVACLGTAVNERHIALMRRFADRITLLLDGDEAGQRRTNEVLELFVAAQADLRVLTLPDEYDPCEFLQERGADEFRRVAEKAVDALEHKIRTATAGINIATETHRANKAMEEILDTLAKAPASTTLSASAQQLRMQQMLSRLAREFRVPEAGLRTRLRDLRTRSGVGRVVVENEQAPRLEPIRLAELPKAEVQLIEILSTHPGMAPTALEELGRDDFTSSVVRDLFDTYRQLEEAGHDLDFSVVLSALSDERLKSLFVEIDETAQAKLAAQARRPEGPADQAQLLRDTIDRLRNREQERVQQERLAALEAGQLDDDKQASLMAQLLEEQRRKRGLSHG